MLTLTRHLSPRWRVSVACPASAGGDVLLTRAKETGACAVSLDALRNRSAEAALAAWLSAAEFDVVHIHAGIAWEGHGATRATLATDTPVVVRTEHLPRFVKTRAQAHEHLELVRQLDALVCVSAEGAETFSRAGVPSRLLHVIRNGVDVPRPRRSRREVLASLGLPSDAKVALTVGRMAMQKGYEYLLDAVPIVLEAAPDTRFLWVGDGPRRRRLAASVRARRLHRSVFLPGRSGAVADLLCAADVLVLPSLFEGLPLVVLEAMAAGVPVVATDACGTRECISDGLTGRVVARRDPGALAHGVIDTLRDPAAARVRTIAARRRYEEAFTAERMAEDVEVLYEELLEHSPRRPLLEKGTPPLAAVR